MAPPRPWLGAVAVLVLIVALAAPHNVLVTAKKLKTRRTGDLKKARDQTTDGVLTLTDANFTAFAMEGPRPYGLAILFTARDEQYRCTHCARAEEEFALLSRSYLKAPETDPPVFFAVADFPDNYGAYRAYNFKMAPVLVVRPVERFRNGIPKPKDWTDESTKFGIMRPDKSAAHVAAFVKQVVGVDIAIYVPPESMALVATACVLVLGVVAACLAAQPTWMLFVRKRWFWFGVSVAVYAFAVSGMVLCIIRQPMWWYESPTKKHKYHFFSGESNSQFVVEGMLIGVLNVLCAGAAIGLFVVSKKERSTFAHVAGTCVCIGLFTAAYLTIALTYSEKTRWYSVDAVTTDFKGWLRGMLGAQWWLR